MLTLSLPLRRNRKDPQLYQLYSSTENKMASRIKALFSRSKTPLTPEESVRATLIRRNKITSKLLTFAPHLRSLLLVVGLIYTLALPHEDLGRRHYISENALQPAQVSLCSRGIKREGKLI